MLHPNEFEFREAILTFTNTKFLKNAMNILNLHGVKCHPETNQQKIKQLSINAACWNNDKNKKNLCSIYVSNFPQTFNEKDLERCFWSFKDFKQTTLKSSSTGLKYAFVSFKSEKGANKAINKSSMNMITMMTMTITMEMISMMMILIRFNLGLHFWTLKFSFF